MLDDIENGFQELQRTHMELYKLLACQSHTFA